MTQRNGAKKTKVVAVPKDQAEVAEFIHKIACSIRNIESIKSDLEAKVADMTEAATQKVKLHKQVLDELFEGVNIFAQAHRAELTDNDKTKTVILPTGTMSWRLTPPAVTLKNVQRVIQQILTRDLKQFLRFKEPEIDKNAMLANPDLAKSIPGVKITQREEFVVKPSIVDIEVTRTFKSKKSTEK